MAVDIYIRNEEDPNYQGNRLETRDTLEMFIMEIEMIFATRKTEVMGEHRFGLSLEEMLYTLKFNESQIKQELNKQIELYSTLVAFFDYEIRVNFYKGTKRDIGVIDFDVNGTTVTGFMVK